jgi:hypothetical protein
MFERFRWFWRLWGAYDEAADAAKEAGVDAKSLFKSKTFWFNLIGGMVTLLQAQGVFALIPQPYDALVLAIGNVVLRIVTTQPVSVP